MPRLRVLAERGANFVIWGPIVEGMPGRYVCSDNAGGARQAVRHLLSLGRRRIAFTGGASDHWPEFRLRYDGYARALRNAGLEPDPALQADAQSSEAAGYEAACRLLDAGVGFDAVFAASDRIAFGVIGALRDRGLAVPRDVAVVGFDDIATAAHFNPSLTTVRQDTERAAEMLVDNLLRLITGETVDSALIEPRLVVRTSCGINEASR
jgi:DNA-binding LacI/PurR family transcriptional regulator